MIVDDPVASDPPLPALRVGEGPVLFQVSRKLRHLFYLQVKKGKEEFLDSRQTGDEVLS